jgi:hypothetical protein
MRASAGIVLFVLAHGVAGCNSPAPTTATPMPSTPAPPPAPAMPAYEPWNLTSTYLGHTGPEACIPPFDGIPRQPVDGVVRVGRSGESIHFLTEHNHYVGTAVGDEFSATENDDSGGTWQCDTARFRFRTEGSVSGRFSGDGRTLAGEEVAVFLLESGETIRRQWSWHATRQ